MQRAEWLGNVRLPPQTLRDQSDAEWFAQLKAKYGAERVHIGPPKACEGLSAADWAERDMSGLYLDSEVSDGGVQRA